jgi:uncharacterized protein YuzE
MRVRYFEDTDTLLIEFRDAPVTETRDLDENTIMDFDAKGNICSITIEHASMLLMYAASCGGGVVLLLLIATGRLAFGARGDPLLPNHRFERAVTRRWLCAASALRYSALTSHWTRLRAAAQPHR